MKTYKSYTNSMRHVCLINKSILSNHNRDEFISKLLVMFNKHYSGRNNSGHITVFTKGKRKDRFYRYIDFKRNIYNVPGIIYCHEYDPNRSSFISLVVYKNNICCYILGVKHLSVGDFVSSYKTNFLNEMLYNKGDSNKLLYLPVNSMIHNLELWPNSGGVYIRSAGTFGKILKKMNSINKVLVELPSGIYVYTSIYSSATLGVVSNMDHHKIILGKAGRKRWLGYKSIVRGVAMNPIDHPHGGGEGKRSADAFKKSPWGKVLRWKNKKKIKIFDLI